MEWLSRNTHDECVILRFQLKLDKVIHIMLAGQLRCDIDDGLLEKLLGFFQSGCSVGRLRELLQASKLIPFFETVLKSLDAGSEDLSTDTISFGIRALAIFLKKSDFFHLMQNETSSLTSLCSLIVKKPNLSNIPTVQVAILSCFSGLASSRAGRKLLISNGCSESAFLYLGANSCYVRKEAVEFLSYFLIQLFPECSAGGHFKQQLDVILERLLLSILSKNGPLRESCILVLKTSLEGYDSHLVALHLITHVLDNLHNTWLSVPPTNLSNNMLNLIAVCHKYRVGCMGNHIDGHKMVELLIEHGLNCEAIYLSAKILKSNKCTDALITASDIQVIMHPVILLTEEGKDTSKKNIKLLQDKGRWTAAIQTSFTSLSGLINLLDDAALMLIFDIICIAFQNFTVDEDRSIIAKLLKKRKTVSLIHQLTLQIVDEKCFQKVGLHQKLLLFDCLVDVLTNSSDCKVACENLKLVSHVVRHEDEKFLKRYLYDQQKRSKLVDALQVKLFDTQWPVVDSCLEVIHAVVISLKNSELSEFWQHIICTPGIHTATWDIAFESKADGYVRASCISFLTTLSFIKDIFEDLKHCRGISEETFVSSLCLLSQDPDVFVQRESITSLVQCLNLKDIESNERIFRTFASSVHRSLDCQVKISILNAWNIVREAYFSVSFLSESNVFDALQFLCHIGYGFTLLYTSSDCDRTVCIRAIQELLNLRKFFLSKGLSSLSINCDSINLYMSSVNPGYKTNSTSKPLPFVTREARDKAISDVLEMDTVDQLTKVMKPVEQGVGFPLSDQVPNGNKFSCSTLELWKFLWSPDIQKSLETSEKSSDMYVDNPEALLDDIIAAREEINLVGGEYQDADCY